MIHRFPSQINREFHLFLSIFEKLLSEISKHKPSLCVIIVTLMQDLPLGGLKTSTLQRDGNCFN